MKKLVICGLIAFLILAIITSVFLYINQNSYYSVGRFAIVNGKLAFEATKFTGKNVIVYDGKEYGKEYDSVYKPQEIGGKLTFDAYKKSGQETNHYIIWGDEIIGDTDDYYSPSYPVEVNGTIAYEAYFNGTKSKANGKSKIVYNGQIYGGKYEWTSEIADINGALTYVGKRDGKDYVVYNSVEIGEGENPTSINGTLAYLSGNRVIFGDEIIEGGDDSIPQGYRDKVIYNVNDKPAFVATREGKSFIVYDGKEYGAKYTKDKSEVYYRISEVAGKLAYSYGWIEMIKLNYFETFDGFVVYDGKEYGTEYDSAQFPFEINGKLGYIAGNSGKEFIVIDGETATGEYKDISFVVDVEGKLIYLAKKLIGYSVYTYPKNAT